MKARYDWNYTNVLVRYLAKDAPDQTMIATGLIENKYMEPVKFDKAAV